MEVKNTCHRTASSRRKFEQNRPLSLNFIKTPIRNSHDIRSTKSESALKHHKICSLCPSLEISVKPLPPLNGMYSTLPAGGRISHPQCSLDMFEELRREIKRISTSRDKLYGRRLQLKEKRNELRQERSLLMALDAKFIRSVRENPRQSNEIFEEIYTQQNSQRDVVGELQYDYDQVEDEHDIAENQLDKEEETLVKLLQKFLHKDNDDENSSGTSENGGLEPDRSPEPNTYDEGQMRLIEYQSRIGDARIMQERLQDFHSERERRLSFVRKRGNVNDDDSDEDFSEQLDATAKELDVINADIQCLKEALQNDGYLDISPVEQSEQIPVLQEVFDPLPHPPTTPKKGRPLSDSVMPNLQKHFGIARARISRWILVTFGNSPLEHIRHKDMIRDLGDWVLDDRKWARRVFEVWKKDDEISLSGSWDEIGQQDLPEYDGIPSSILLSSRSKAEDAVGEYEQQFPFPNGASRDRSTPYGPNVELDLLSEYESRSI